MSSLPPAQWNSSMCQVTCHRKQPSTQARGLRHHGGNHLCWENWRKWLRDPSWELPVMDSQIGTLCPHHKPPLGHEVPSLCSPPCCYAVRYWLIHALLYKSRSSHCAHTRLTLTSLGQHSTGVPHGCGSLPLVHWHTVQGVYTTRCRQPGTPTIPRSCGTQLTVQYAHPHVLFAYSQSEFQRSLPLPGNVRADFFLLTEIKYKIFIPTKETARATGKKSSAFRA